MRPGTLLPLCIFFGIIAVLLGTCRHYDSCPNKYSSKSCFYKIEGNTPNY